MSRKKRYLKAPIMIKRKYDRLSKMHKTNGYQILLINGSTAQLGIPITI